MSLSAEQLKAPQGELEESFFPLGDLGDRLDAWLAEANARVGSLASAIRDSAAKAYVYYRAFDAIQLRLSTEPASVSLDSGKTERTYTRDQIAELRRRRDEYRAEFNSYFQSTPSATVATGQITSVGTTKAADVGKLKL